MSNEEEIKMYLEFARKVVIGAGEVLKEAINSEKRVEFKGNLGDVVTEEDKKIEGLLISKLSEEYPDHKFIGEESWSLIKEDEKEEGLKLTSSPTWIIDPIDGTINFVHGFSQCCISVALSINGEVMLGLIYNPVNGELYEAQKGKGSFLNGNKLKVSKVRELNSALIILEPALIKYTTKYRDILMGRVEALSLVADGIRSVGSAALALAYVARGVVDAFHLDNLKPWDIAAGYLIVLEAGGTVIDTKGGPYNFMKPMTLAAANDTLATTISKLIIDTDLATQRKRLRKTQC